MPNHMTNRTPEQKQESARKMVETKRKNIEIRNSNDQALKDSINPLKIKIKKLREEIKTLETHKIFNEVSISLSGKGLATEAEIVSKSQPYEHISGVYFLIKNDRIIYVGQSVSIFTRISVHAKEKIIPFDSVAWSLCNYEIMNHIESLYIHLLRPACNGNQTDGYKFSPILFADLFKVTK